VKRCPACGAEYPDDASFCARDRTPLPTAPGEGGLVGTVLADRFRIERKLGEGGMGEVYLARHVLMDRPCAIKLMARGWAKDADALARFNREATNASRISHPNVCAIYDFGTTSDGVVYLAMEYVEGRPLSDLLAGGPLSTERAVELAGQAAAGLAAAHELGIVHRDLKPDNIMVVEQRGRAVVKLVDFGIAKAAAADQGQRVTRTGLVVGTPEYMSPEQLAGDEVDGRSDQYALALVVFRMLTGALPFAAATAQETMVKRLTERPRRLSEGAPGTSFPPGLEAAIDRALRRRREERFETVDRFAAELRQAVRGGAAAPPLPRTEKVSAPRRLRRPMLVGALGVAALGVAVAVWRIGPGRAERKDAGGAPAPPPEPTAPLPAAPGPPQPSPVTSQVSGPGAADSSPATVRAPALRPSPAPATPPPGLPNPDSGLDPPAPDGRRRLPVPEDFDDPQSSRGRWADLAAQRVLARPAAADSVRAEMAWLLASHRMLQGRRLEAARLWRLSCRLDPKPRCARMLPQLDTVP
jgi:serine/threonine-protein kinase